MYGNHKVQFVEECYPESVKSRDGILSTLNLLEEYEQDWDMDFTLQDVGHLQNAFNNVVPATYIGSKTVLSRFRKYAKWRIKKGLPCSNGVFELEADRTTAMRESMVSSPEHLARILDYVFDDPVLGTIDIIYRVFLWMGFSGIEDTEAVRVTRHELDFAQKKIYHDGKSYPLYSESKYDFRIASDLREFAKGNKYYIRADGEEIMRGKANRIDSSPMKQLVGTIRPTLVRKLEIASRRNQESDKPIDIGLDLSYNRIYMSGKFYRLYQRELDGNPPDFGEYANEEFDKAQRSDSPYRVSKSNPQWGIILRLKKSTESDYLSWKNAFFS